MFNNLIPKEGFTRANMHGPSPSDALQMGVHSSLSVSSKHKRMVSGALHLKRESVGAKSHPTAFKSGIHAFHPKTEV